MKLNTEACCCIPLLCFTPFLLNQCAMKSKYVVSFVEASSVIQYHLAYCLWDYIVISIFLICCCILSSSYPPCYAIIQ